MSDAMEAMRAKVAEAKSIMAAAKALIASFADRLREALDNEDDGALEALVADLDGGADDLAAAVAENTPVAEHAEREEPLPEPATPGEPAPTPEPTAEPAPTTEEPATPPGAGESEDTTGDEGGVNTQ